MKQNESAAKLRSQPIAKILARAIFFLLKIDDDLSFAFVRTPCTSTLTSRTVGDRTETGSTEYYLPATASKKYKSNFNLFQPLYERS